MLTPASPSGGSYNMKFGSLVFWFINTVTYLKRSGRLEVERALPRAFKRATERPLHPSPDGSLKSRECIYEPEC